MTQRVTGFENGNGDPKMARQWKEERTCKRKGSELD